MTPVKLWANSADSHFIEPPDLWQSRLPKRLAELNDEGIWSELVFPSMGMWSSSFRTPELLREAMRASNDRAKETILDYSPRLIPTAQVSTLDIDDAVADLNAAGRWGSRPCSCQ